jgi:hypothetical protein
MLRSERVRNSSRMLEVIGANPAAEAARPRLEQWLAKARAKEAEAAAENFLTEHAEEIACGDQPFELVPAGEGEDDPLDKLLNRAKNGDIAVVAPEETKELSLLQRIGLMRVGDRIKLAMRGNRGERMVLIRDRSKLVSLAVLESPKVNDSEMETFASMKNVQEAVLRGISTKRNYMKNYGVLRALVNNPKTPMDVVLPLLAFLLVKDLRALTMNKNVTETVRKVAMKLFRTKTDKKAVEDGKNNCGRRAVGQNRQAQLWCLRVPPEQGISSGAGQSESERGVGCKSVSVTERGGERRADRYCRRISQLRCGAVNRGRGIGIGDSGAVAARECSPRQGCRKSATGGGGGGDGQVHPKRAPQIRALERKQSRPAKVSRAFAN